MAEKDPPEPGYVTGLVISNVEINNCRGDAIRLRRAHDVKISNVRVDGITGRVIDIGQASEPQPPQLNQETPQPDSRVVSFILLVAGSVIAAGLAAALGWG